MLFGWLTKKRERVVRLEDSFAFLQSVESSSPGFCTFASGVAESVIEEFEATSGLKLASDFKALLQESNGVEFLGRDAQLFGISFSASEVVSDIARSTLGGADVIEIGQRSTGDLFCLFWSGESKRWSYRIWNPELGEWTGEYKTLIDFLRAECSFWTEVLEEEAVDPRL